MSALTVSPCVERDWPRVVELLVQVFVGEGHVSAERGRQVNRRERIEPWATVLTAKEGGAVLGVVVLPHRESQMKLLAGEDEAEIRMLAVDPAARGRGVGEILVRECVRRAAAAPHSARAVVLWTQPQMTAAQRLYERLGFRRAAERDGVVPAHSERDDPARLVRWAYVRALP